MLTKPQSPQKPSLIHFLVDFEIYLILLTKSMQKSSSLPKLPSQAYISRQSSLKSIDSRLNFPTAGDSSIFKNVGRKHFQNHTDRMLKIILPQKYSVEKPIPIRRQNSLPPPHLIRHDSERLFQNRHQIKNDMSNLITKQASLREKIEDQLDRMRRSMQKPKHKKLPEIKMTQKLQIQQKSVPSSSRNANQNQIRISNLFSLTPSIPTKIQNQQQSRPRLLYNPQNKQKYDALLMGRWKNPTNLSTGLSII